jgi:cytochrome b involved in lipid metabolism
MVQPYKPQNQSHQKQKFQLLQVYNMSPYLKFHPGGVAIMAPALGKDATSLFQKYHPWVNIDALIGQCQTGYLQQNARADSASEPPDMLLDSEVQSA